MFSGDYITEIVGSPDGPTQSYSFTSDNSAWELFTSDEFGEAPPGHIWVLEITEQRIWIQETCISGLYRALNCVSLLSPGTDQQIYYNSPGCGVEPWTVLSTNSDLTLENGRYEGGGRRFLLATRTRTPVPLPASGLLLIDAEAAPGAHRARRISA
jgi:hypothetical protein